MSFIYVERDGKKYYAPFYCLCCGIEITAEQFAFGRACSRCDVGACRNVNYGGLDHPTFLRVSNKGKKIFK